MLMVTGDGLLVVTGSVEGTTAAWLLMNIKYDLWRVVDQNGTLDSSHYLLQFY